MSYSFAHQVNKPNSNSKYLYANIDQSEEFFIFDIKIISNKKKFKKIRKIKNTKSDTLIDLTDRIKLDKYTNIEITIISINNPTIQHSIKLDLTTNTSIYKDNFIYLEMTSECNMLKCFYNLDIN
jgi:hypothetical protein